MRFVSSRYSSDTMWKYVWHVLPLLLNGSNRWIPLHLEKPHIVRRARLRVSRWVLYLSTIEIQYFPSSRITHDSFSYLNGTSHISCTRTLSYQIDEEPFLMLDCARQIVSSRLPRTSLDMCRYSFKEPLFVKQQEEKDYVVSVFLLDILKSVMQKVRQWPLDFFITNVRSATCAHQPM